MMRKCCDSSSIPHFPNKVVVDSADLHFIGMVTLHMSSRPGGPRSFQAQPNKIEHEEKQI